MTKKIMRHVVGGKSLMIVRKIVKKSYLTINIKKLLAMIIVRYIFVTLLMVMIATNLSCSEQVDHNLMIFDPVKPYSIALGRGSELDGLNTIKIEENGSVTIHRLSDGEVEPWLSTKITLTQAEVKKIADCIVSNEVTSLRKSYRSTTVDDGEQWIIVITQNHKESTIYCDNKFPKSLTKLAACLDNILLSAGVRQAAWSEVPASKARSHELELWEAIK